ncbi:hypothetical protein [uncultured Cardiobacterium sp.]|uniref:hypothetical protein n=1 Tax=uncultured Cardiobacterium sp. TaxID=417619 RepID=UPI002614B268|nr:hypothetical protein [uncultured Cardiobacterium sp.]
MDRPGAPHKAPMFTESRRTQQYSYDFLQQAGYAAVMFSGENDDPTATAVYRCSALIDSIRRHLQQRVENTPLFTLRWRVI